MVEAQGVSNGTCPKVCRIARTACRLTGRAPVPAPGAESTRSGAGPSRPAGCRGRRSCCRGTLCRCAASAGRRQDAGTPVYSGGGPRSLFAGILYGCHASGMKMAGVVLARAAPRLAQSRKAVCTLPLDAAAYGTREQDPPCKRSRYAGLDMPGGRCVRAAVLVKIWKDGEKTLAKEGGLDYITPCAEVVELVDTLGSGSSGGSSVGVRVSPSAPFLFVPAGSAARRFRLFLFVR